MKYVLNPDNRNCPDEVLLEDLRLVAGRLSKSSVTKSDYNDYGRFSAATMQKRFGSWNTALQKCGLVIQKRMDIPQDELLLDIQRVAAILGTKVLSTSDYGVSGKFSVPTITRTFGSWPKALEAAKLEVSSSWHPKATDDELMSNLAAVWEAIARQPKKSDLHPPISRFSAHSYVRRFGSWRQTLELLVSTANQPIPSEPSTPEVEIKSIAPQAIPRRTQRDPGWKLKFLVRQRDRFSCRACGRSPAMHPGVVLHFDHIVPWSQGGETTFENLQTLCEVCNIGKSDLPMHAHEDAQAI